METKVISLIADTLEVDKDKITSDTNLIQDLEVESLDLVDLVAAFEEQFNIEIPDKDIKNLQTVGDIIAYAEAHQR
ncbi:acyl carrier protein [Candidatus Saccharibacteria bacterium]|nr:acyl carrier protein [Candidatus Saccharibacteria bacterium]